MGRLQIIVKGTAGPGEAPDLLGDPVHIDCKANAAITDQGQAQLFLSHQAMLAGATGFVEHLRITGCVPQWPLAILS